MTPQEDGDRIDAAAYSVDELREAVFEGRGRLARPLALGLLSRKDYPGKVSDLARVLADEREVPRLRAMAAGALSSIQGAPAVAALEAGLAAGDQVTVLAVVKALAQAGTAVHLGALEAVAARPGPVGGGARRALDVLRARLGEVGAGGAPASPRTLERTGATVPIAVRDADDSSAAAAIGALPSRRLTRTGALSLECQGRRLLFAFGEEAFGRGLRIADEAREIGIVAEARRVEGAGWEPRYRVTAEPAAQQAFTLRVTTFDGRPLMAGSGRTDRGEVTFELAALSKPGALAIDVAGRFDGQRLVIDRAASAARRTPTGRPQQLRRR